MAFGTPQGNRLIAAAQALGAPKAAPNKPTARKTINLPQHPQKTKSQNVKMQTQKGTQRNHSSGNHTSGNQSSGSSGQPKATAQKSFIEMNPAQLQHLATKQVQQQTQSELAPLKAQAGQIAGTEATVAKRFGGYGETTDKLLGGMQAEQANSAKTFQNAAADAAIKSQGEVETTGQAAANANAGYVDPQLRAQLSAEASNAAGTGAAQSATASAMAQSGGNLLAGIRAAAADRVTEGQRGITSTFDKQRGENQAAQNKVLGGQAGGISKLNTELTQKAFADRATASQIKLKSVAQEQKEREAEVKAALAKRAQNITRADSREGNTVKVRGQNITAEKNSITQKHYEATDQAARQRAEAALKKASGGLTTSEQDKVASEIGSAYNTVQALRIKGVPESKIPEYLNNGSRRVVEEYSKRNAKTGKTEKGEKAVTEQLAAVKNPALQRAALELWKYHKVSPQTEASLHTLGVKLTGKQIAALVGL